MTDTQETKAKIAFSELMAGQTILPIIQANSVTQGVKIAECMAEAGLGLVEVVLRTQASLDVITEIKKSVPQLIVGAGTVTNGDILRNAVEAGADFIVTPAVSERLLQQLNNCELPSLPGVSNTADILMAQEHGFSEMKLFPASLSGGIPFLSAVSSVFNGVTFCPTGGINRENKQDYMALLNVFAVGGTWMAKKQWVDSHDWQAIHSASKDAAR